MFRLDIPDLPCPDDLHERSTTLGAAAAEATVVEFYPDKFWLLDDTAREEGHRVSTTPLLGVIGAAKGGFEAAAPFVTEREGLFCWRVRASCVRKVFLGRGGAMKAGEKTIH